jgi:hypothetical protein
MGMAQSTIEGALILPAARTEPDTMRREPARFRGRAAAGYGTRSCQRREPRARPHTRAAPDEGNRCLTVQLMSSPAPRSRASPRLSKKGRPGGRTLDPAVPKGRLSHRRRLQRDRLEVLDPARLFEGSTLRIRMPHVGSFATQSSSAERRRRLRTDMGRFSAAGPL